MPIRESPSKNKAKDFDEEVKHLVEAFGYVLETSCPFGFWC